MKNYEKYAEDLHNIFLDSFGVDEENKPFRCPTFCGGQCQFYNNKTDCKILAKQWLDEEYKTDWSKVPVDTPILVKCNASSEWSRRYFAKYEDGKVFAWCGGATSWSTENSGFANDWKYAELYDNKKEN